MYVGDRLLNICNRAIVTLAIASFYVNVCETATRRLNAFLIRQWRVRRVGTAHQNVALQTIQSEAKTLALCLPDGWSGLRQ